MTYSVLAEVRDSFGNTGTAQALLPVDDLPPVPGQAAITPTAKGFSPNYDGAIDTIGFSLAVPNPDSVNAWKVQIAQADGLVRKTFSGSAASLKDALTWAGRDDTGSPAPEGIYTASMSVDYGSVYKAISVSSRKFVLALTPPKGKLQTAPDAVVPDEDGFVAPATISLDGSSALAQMASWKVEVADSSGKPFGSYQGAWPPGRLAWGGVAADGSLASPGAAYQVTAVVTDEFGLSTKIQSSIQVGDPAQGDRAQPGGGPRPWILSALGRRHQVLAVLRQQEPHEGLEPRHRAGRQDRAHALSRRPLRTAGQLHLERPAPGRLGRSRRHVLRAAQPGLRASLRPRLGHEPGLHARRHRADRDHRDRPPALLPGRLGRERGHDRHLASTRARDSPRSTTGASRSQDPGGNSFASFHGLWPAGQIKWDGRNAKNELVESAEDYPVTARVRDEFGNTLELKSAVNVDILIVKMGDGYRIRIASIVFKPFTADFLDVAPDIAERNVSTLNLLAEKLKKFPGYQIRMVGHAVMVNWDNPALGKVEQEKELIPLSKARAEAIMQALAQRGIDPARMVTDGVGSSDQIVSDSDFADRWKNRRVEFFLQRK